MLVIHHLLQPVFRLLLRLVAAAAVVVVVPLLLLLLPQKSSKSLASEPDSESMSATRISLMAPSSFIFFSGHCNRHIQVCLIYTPLYDWAQVQ